MNRRALVVGAAGGVGTEVVKHLLSAGYSVIGTVYDDAEEGRLRTAVPAVAQIHQLDLADANQVLATLKRLLTAIDAVVVCAANCPCGPLELEPLDVLRRTLEINSISCLAVFQATMPLLRESKGRIVFISSFAGKVAPPFVGHYAASKHALEALGDVMRREAKKSGVDVILIEPGGIRTQMINDQVLAVKRGRASLSTQDAQLYGGFYDSYAALTAKSWDNSVEPAVVAATIALALAENHPKARYQVGEDSKLLCDIARRSDLEIDAAVESFWGSA